MFKNFFIINVDELYQDFNYLDFKIYFGNYEYYKVENKDF